MMQGDSYNLEVEILHANGDPVAPAEVADVEITVGPIRKTYAAGEVTFSEDLNKWLLPITQEDSFRLPAVGVPSQARVLWAVGGVVGVSLGRINIHESISKEVL